MYNCKLTDAIIATIGGAQLQPGQLSLGPRKLTSGRRSLTRVNEALLFPTARRGGRVYLPMGGT
jgi:hypothetical protein